MPGARAAPAGGGPRTDAALADHAAELSAKYLGGRAVPSSVRWVSNQNSRWGSATPSEGTIRLSEKLRPMPQWVIDYVLLHELAHLLVAGHNAAFWRLLEAYPETERAKAFLEGVIFATSRGPAPRMTPITTDAGHEEAPAAGTERSGRGRSAFLSLRARPWALPPSSVPVSPAAAVASVSRRPFGPLAGARSSGARHPRPRPARRSRR